jgi:hypothetical protein
MYVDVAHFSCTCLGATTSPGWEGSQHLSHSYPVIRNSGARTHGSCKWPPMDSLKNRNLLLSFPIGRGPRARDPKKALIAVGPAATCYCFARYPRPSPAAARTSQASDRMYVYIITLCKCVPPTRGRGKETERRISSRETRVNSLFKLVTCVIR